MLGTKVKQRKERTRVCLVGMCLYNLTRVAKKGLIEKVTFE